MIAGIGAAVLLTVAGVPSPAVAAGVIGGTVWMTPAARAAGARSSPGRAQRGVHEAVVYVVAVPDRVERKLAGRRRWWFGRAKPQLLHVVQVDRQFKPRVAAVAAGASVEFRNLDRVYHGAFSVSPAKRFDLGKYPPGRVDTLRFDRPGLVNLHCEIHPGMVGYLVVAPNHAFVRPDSFGRFALPRLPPGTYTVRAVHPTRGEARQRVVVPKRGDVDIEMVLR